MKKFSLCLLFLLISTNLASCGLYNDGKAGNDWMAIGAIVLGVLAMLGGGGTKYAPASGAALIGGAIIALIG